MTEPQSGSDPLLLKMSAGLAGNEWVINGERWFASNARYASFFITMVVTDPDADPHTRMSMFIVPAETPGIEIVRNYGFHGEAEPVHGHVRWEGVGAGAEELKNAFRCCL
jgi:acyl-CoA dehydrogenase